MTTLNKNLAMVLIAVVAVSTGGVLAYTENAQPLQTPTSQKEQPLVLGHIELVAKDSQGNIQAYRQTDNLVVSNGLNATINQLFGSAALAVPASQLTSTTVNTFKFVGVGTSATAAAYTQTNLLTQQGNKVSGTVSPISSGGGTGMGGQIVGNWAANRLQNGSGTAAITEAGLFDGFANGTSNMYARQTFSAINVAAADTLQVTWKITYSHSP